MSHLESLVYRGVSTRVSDRFDGKRGLPPVWFVEAKDRDGFWVSIETHSTVEEAEASLEKARERFLNRR